MEVSFVIDLWSITAGFVLGAIVTFVTMAVIAVRMRDQQNKSASVQAASTSKSAPAPVRIRKAK